MKKLLAAFLSVAVLPSVASAELFPGAKREIDRQALIAKLSSDINKVDHSIDVTKQLIKKSGDATYVADLYFRLAELYVEKSRYVYSRIMEQLPENETTLSGDQALEVQITKKLAVETYDRILRDFPEYKKNDQVRFFRAHEHRELGAFETMLSQYRELIKEHPKSAWAIEARVILGDHHFDKDELETAEGYYREVTELPESHMHDMARFKLGWIRINQEKWKDALKLFERAVTSATKRRKGAVGDASRLDVKREALLAMVWPFSEAGKPAQSLSYFRKLARSKTEYLAALRRLANRYYIKTQYNNSALLYREIVRLSSGLEQNVEYVQRIYDSVRNMSARNPRRYANAREDVDAIVATIARFENALGFKERDKAALKKDFEVRARDLATRLHVESKSRSDTRRAKVAADAYRKYLSLFENKEFRAKMQLNRAEALYQAREYQKAGSQYEELARSLPSGNGQRDGVYEAILSYHKAIEADSEYRDKHPTEDGLLNKLELLRSREGLKQLGAYFVRNYPKSPKAPNVKFNIARMYYQQGDFDKSTELFALFVEQYPRHKDIAIAGNLALDGLNQLDAYDRMSALAKKFVDNPKITNRAFKNEAARIAEAARKRKVEFTVISASEEDFSEAMLSQWEKHKGTAEGEEYLYTAFLKFKGEGNIAGVFDFGGRLIGAYPKSKRLSDVVATMGNFALRGADFERAAFLFEEFYKRFPKDKNAKAVLASSANIRFFLGQYEKAIASYRVVRSVGSSGQQIEANERLLEMYERTQDWEGLVAAAKAALRGSRSAAPYTYAGLAYSELGQYGQAQNAFQQAIAGQANTDFASAAKARGAFELGQLFHRQFDSIKFGDPSQAETVLGQKIQLMQQIEQLYVSAIQSGEGRWVIASLHEAARAYGDFASFISNAPIPPGLNGTEVQQYKSALRQQSEPYQAKAKETRKACSKKADQFNVFTRFAAACVGAEVVATAGRRGGGSQDEGYLQELAKMRGKLAQKPENIRMLKDIAKRAMRQGDFHLAKMTLIRASEVNPRDSEVMNLTGVCDWSLGEPTEAYQGFSSAHKSRLAEASLNLAALLFEYGYVRKARRYFERVGVGGRDLENVALHPAVRKMVQEFSGS